MLIIFDAVDKSGKDTLIRELHKRTNYQHVIINRFLASNYVYGQFRNRNVNLKDYLKYDNALAKHAFIFQVILFADKKDLIKRFKKHGETDLNFEEIDSVVKLYNEYVKQTKIKTLVLNTSCFNVEQCVNKILRFVND